MLNLYANDVPEVIDGVVAIDAAYITASVAISNDGTKSLYKD